MLSIKINFVFTLLEHIVFFFNPCTSFPSIFSLVLKPETKSN